MECKICLDDYNSQLKKPKIITSCGHTFCEVCLNEITKCPTCRRQITGTVINYDTLDLVDNNITKNSTISKLKIDEKIELTEIEVLKNEFKENKQDLSYLIEQKLKKSKDLFKSLREQINNDTEVKIRTLTNKNDILTSELNEIESKIDTEFSLKKFDNERNENFWIAKLETRQFDSKELSKIKNESNQNQKKLIENLDKIDFNYFFVSDLQDIQIGKIVKETNQIPNEEKDAFSSASAPIYEPNLNESRIQLRKLSEIAVLTEHANYVTSVTVLPDSQIASGSWDNTIIIWSQNGSPIKKLHGHTDCINVLIMLPDGTLASCSSDKTIRIWDLNTGKTIRILEGHGQAVLSLILLRSCDGPLLASSAGDQIIIWNVFEQKLKPRILPIQKNITVYCLVGLSDGNKLAAGSQEIRILDIQTGQTVSILTGHSKFVNSLVVLPNETILASASADFTIRLWDLNYGTTIRILYGHTSDVWSLLVLSDSTLASGGGYNDKSIRLWNTVNGETIQVLKGHTNSVSSLAILGNSILISGSRDNTIRLWN